MDISKKWVAAIMLVIIASFAAYYIKRYLRQPIDLPQYMEFDLDNWTRLYRGGDQISLLRVPEPGDISRAFITINNISPTEIGNPPVQDPGGIDGPPTWIGGETDNTYLHGWEDNIVIQPVSPNLPEGGVIEQQDGSLNIYFTHVDDSSWEFVVYRNKISTIDFIQNDSNFLGAGPTRFDFIQTNLSNNDSSTPFVRGRFSESLYFDQALANNEVDLGHGIGYISAIAAIRAPAADAGLGGDWLNQVLTPHELGINVFIDVDPTWGYGAQIKENLYADCFDYTDSAGTNHSWCNSDPYDLAIQNVRYDSVLRQPNLDNDVWIISDDAVRLGKNLDNP